MVRDGLWTKLRRAVGSIDFAQEARLPCTAHVIQKLPLGSKQS